MTTEIDETNAETGGATPEEEKRFTQADLDALITKRLAEERSRRDREEKEKAKKVEEQAKLAKLEGEERIRAEYEAKLKEIQESEAQAKRSLAISKVETMLSAQRLPPELAPNLLGEDDEATKSNVDAFVKAVSAEVAKQVAEGLSHGTPPSSGGNSPSADDVLKAKLDRLMNMKR